MTVSSLALKLAKQKGENIAKEFSDSTLSINILAIAKKHNIVVKPKSDISNKGVSGMLLRHGNSFGIMYSTYINNKGFQRFSIAHELGHYFLEGHLDHIFNIDGIHESSAEFISNNSYELEADHFASGLLMPDDLIRPIIMKSSPGLFTIKRIMVSCNTSLISSAIKYTALSKDAVAIIVSKGTKVDFCFLSQNMQELPEYSWPNKQSFIPPDSLTAQFNKNKNSVLKGEFKEGDLDIREWLGGTISLQTKEEVQGLGPYGKTLTVLTCLEDIEEICHSHNRETELVESWTPHF